MKTANLEINGMTGRASVNGVRSALSVIRGVAGVEVSLESGQANVCFDPHKAIPEQFKKAVWVMGCEVEKISVQDGAFLANIKDGVNCLYLTVCPKICATFAQPGATASATAKSRR